MAQGWRSGVYRMLIGGHLVEAIDAETTVVINPATEQEIARVPNAGAQDAAAAVDAAADAFPGWRTTPLFQRVGLCSKLADAIVECQDELGLLESRDTGNCVGPMTRDVGWAADVLRYFAGLAPEIKGMSVPASDRGLHFTVREPYGVVVGIAAFNHPFLFALTKIAAPLVAGNTVVLKPPPQAPLTSLALAELALDIFPAGVLNIVAGDSNELGAALVADTRVRRITLTGSVPTGKAIMRAASDRLAGVTLELGGKNPLLVFPDANPETAARGAIRAMNFAWQGQSCGSTSRVLVHESLHEAFCRHLVRFLEEMRIGSPQDPDTDIGALISRAQYDRVLAYIAAGREDGAQVLTGGGRPAGLETGFFIEPTVFDEVTEDMRVFREEIFGPIMAVTGWSAEDEALRLANSGDYGLTANLYTNDLPTVLRVVPQLEAGYVWVNGLGEHFTGLPFGGVKESGLGREESLDELLSFTQCKSVSLLTLNP